MVSIELSESELAKLICKMASEIGFYGTPGALSVTADAGDLCKAALRLTELTRQYIEVMNGRSR